MCSHTNTKDGYCTSCGFQIKEATDYQHIVSMDHLNTFYSIQNYSLSFQNLYSTNTISKNDILLDKLISNFNIFYYKNQIKNELKIKKFKSRLSPLNKYLLVIYKILRDDSFPILFSDIVKYSSNIKKYWFKEYKFIPYTEEYIRNVLDRIISKKELENENNCEFRDEIKYENNFAIKFKYTSKYENELKDVICKLCSYEIEKILVGWLYVKGFTFEQDFIKGINLDRLIKKIKLILGK